MVDIIEIDSFDDNSDLKKLLTIAFGSTNEELKIRIESSCSSITNFCEQSNKWLAEYGMSISEYILLAKLISLYKKALICCDEYDIELEENQQKNFLNFCHYVTKNDPVEFKRVLNTDEIKTRSEDIFKLAYDVYNRSPLNRELVRKKAIHKFLPEDISSKNSSILTNAFAPIGVCIFTSGLGALVGLSIGFAGATAGSLVGLAGGMYLTKYCLNPYFQEANALDNLVKILEESGLSNEIDLKNLDLNERERHFQDSLELLNLHSSSNATIINRTRANYLKAYDLKELKMDHMKIKKFIKLEKAYQMIKSYKILNETWN